MFGNNKIRTDDVDVILKQHERLYFILSFIIALIANVLSYFFLRFTVGSLMDLFVELDAIDLLVVFFLLVPSIVIEIVAVMSLIRLVRHHVKIMRGEYDITVATVSDRLGEYLQHTMTLYDEKGRLTEVESSYLLNRRVRNESRILYASIRDEKNRIFVPNCRVVTLSKGRMNVVELDEPTDEIKAIVIETTRRKRRHLIISDIAYILIVAVGAVMGYVLSRTEDTVIAVLASMFVYIAALFLMVYKVDVLDAGSSRLLYRIIPCLITGLGATMVSAVYYKIMYALIFNVLWILSFFFWRRPAFRKLRDLRLGRYKVSQGLVVQNVASFTGKYNTQRFVNIRRVSTGIWGNRVYLMDGTEQPAYPGNGHNEYSYKVRADNSAIYEIRTSRSDFNKHPVGYTGLLILRYDPYLREDEALLL